MLVHGKPYILFSIPLRRDDAVAKLTPAEKVIALALVTGASDMLISAARKTSVRTVSNQVRSIFEKLAVGSRAGLIARFGDVDWRDTD